MALVSLHVGQRDQLVLRQVELPVTLTDVKCM